MKTIFLLILIFLININIKAEVFKFNFVKNRKFRIEAFIIGNQYINNDFFLTYKQNYETISLVKDILKDSNNENAVIEDQFYYYDINIFPNYETKELTQTETINYIKDIQGRIIIKNNSVLPTLRNIPFFPQEDLKIGDKWSAPGIEVQDFYNDKSISIFPVNVEYEFLGYEKISNLNLAKFEYKYTLDITNNFDGTIDKRILRIKGVSTTIMFFNNKIGERYKEIYKREYSILFFDNNSKQQFILTFVDNGERVWHPIELMQKDKILKDLKDNFDKEKIENADITKDEKGIKITLENIQFDPESSILREEEIQRLKKIATILKKYKDRGVLIVGHTTDKGTEEGRQKLSLERARTVLDFLIKEDAINIQKSIYTGKGSKEPIAPNDTEEGMKKNRRVEIYILED